MSDLSPLDARVLAATSRDAERTAERIGEPAGCYADAALSALRRLRLRYLVENDGRRRPARWLRTHPGDIELGVDDGA